VGYDPSKRVPSEWRQFHDRVSLNYHAVPAGYFSVFKEIADIVVALITGGAKVGSNFVPDISIGIAWSKHWANHHLSAIYGQRFQYQHNYPPDFPQAASNPQLAYCYPEAALGEFRRWIRAEYLPHGFPKYLKGKERDGALPPSFCELALSAIEDRLTLPPPTATPLSAPARPRT
jgi:hypothetical protein